MKKGNESLSSAEKGALALKNAGQALLVYAFFLGLPVSIMMAIAHGEIDRLGWTILAVISLLIVLLIVAGLLILNRYRGGITLWWIVSPLVLLSFPIGTAVGAYVITCILKPEAREATKGSTQLSPPPLPRDPHPKAGR